MPLEELFADRSLAAKDRSARLAHLLEVGEVKGPALIAFAEQAKPPVKATCLEGLEQVTKARPRLLTEAGLDLCLRALSDKEPRVKWEAARVIGNTIHQFPKRAEEAVNALRGNVAHEGTVVRWSMAYALAQVILLRTPLNMWLLAEVASIIKKEEKSSIRKIYEAAIKKVAN